LRAVVAQECGGTLGPSVLDRGFLHSDRAATTARHRHPYQRPV